MEFKIPAALTSRMFLIIITIAIAMIFITVIFDISVEDLIRLEFGKDEEVPNFAFQEAPELDFITQSTYDVSAYLYSDSIESTSQRLREKEYAFDCIECTK